MLGAVLGAPWPAPGEGGWGQAAVIRQLAGLSCGFLLLLEGEGVVELVGW